MSLGRLVSVQEPDAELFHASLSINSGLLKGIGQERFGNVVAYLSHGITK
jgi:hypothetical protein